MRCSTCKKTQKLGKKRHCWEASNQCATCHYLGKKSTGRGYLTVQSKNITEQELDVV